MTSYFRFVVFFSSILILWANFVRADIPYKENPVDEIDITDTGYYGRLLLAGDFNNDSKKELLYIRLSSTYMRYHWHNTAKRNDAAYHKAGMKLAQKNPKVWNSKFVTHTLNSSNRRGESWNVKFNGTDGCIQPSQIIPANLNKDNFTDFVIVCHGYDVKPWPGEHSLVAVSNGPDNYNVKKFTSNVGFYHDGDVADFNDDGYTDILVVNQGKSKKAEVYINDGMGNFSKSNKYFSQFSKWQGASGTEIIDINNDGNFDIGMFGHEFSNSKPHQTMILLGNNSKKFSTNKKLVVPAVEGWGTVLDMFVEGNNLFVLRSSSKPRYRGVMIQQVNVNTMKTVTTLKNKDMKWYSRIFKKKTKSGFKYGGLTNESNSIDFKLVNGKITLAK